MCYTMIFQCPMCACVHDTDPNRVLDTCPTCGWDLHDELLPESGPDYGGAFDGFTVTSDAEW
jgi:hypothetical protein